MRPTWAATRRWCACCRTAPETSTTLLTGYFGNYGTDNAGLADDELAVATELAGSAEESGKAVVVHSMARETPALTLLGELGVPVYERVEQAVAGIAGAAAWTGLAATEVPGLPERARPLPSGDYEVVRVAAARARRPVPRRRLRGRGRGLPRERRRDRVPRRAQGHGCAAQDRGRWRRPRHPGSRGAGRRGVAGCGCARVPRRYAVERMASWPGSVELIMGVRHDPAFGPVAMVGMGGTTAELAGDTAPGTGAPDP